MCRDLAKEDALNSGRPPFSIPHFALKLLRGSDRLDTSPVEALQPVVKILLQCQNQNKFFKNIEKKKRIFAARGVYQYINFLEKEGRNRRMTIREKLEEREKKDLSTFACLATASKGRVQEEEPCPVRTCFQRDTDRIVHCKAFRRLKHKTQVFLQPEGDHYRTRMTHTLEVSRVAMTIARGLGLNEDLTEAAALGHDLGHTPFGHAGERLLNEIMPGGFRHNEQSLRVVDRLEKDGAGLNLTYEVRRGIVCHSGPDTAESLEGRVVRIADKIAYLSADIDDALRGGVIYPLDIPAGVVQELGSTHSQRINTLVTDIINESQEKPDILQSPAKQEAMAELREFMFASVYLNPVAKGEEGKAQEMIRRLFDYYIARLEKLPEEFQEICEREGKERAVCDYIAGMTDAYAIEQYLDLFIPKSWAVK